MRKHRRIWVDDLVHDGMWVRELMRPDSPFSDWFVKRAATEVFSRVNEYMRQQATTSLPQGEKA